MALLACTLMACSEAPHGPQESSASAEPSASRAGQEALFHGSNVEIDTVGDGVVHELILEDLLAADRQQYPEELATNELVAGPLRALREVSRGPWRLTSWAPDMGDVFAPGARVAVFEGRGEARVEHPATGVRRSTWEGVPEAGDVASFEAWLDRYHEASARVRWAQWKPAEVEFTNSGLTTSVKVTLNRELPGGGIEHRQGRYRMDWVETDGGWRCSRAVPEGALTELRSEAPHWVDATLEAFAGTRFDPRSLERVDGKYRGLALADLDADGDLDLVVAQPLAVLYNRGDGSFTDRTESVLEHAGDGAPVSAMSVLAADFDRDGRADIFFSMHDAHCLLYRQVEPDRFVGADVTATHTDNFPSSLAARDGDGDGFLDVFVAGYGALVNPGPDRPNGATNGSPNQMLRGVPDGGFADVTSEWGLEPHATRWTFAATFGDADADGDSDLYAANDFGPNVLYRCSGRTGEEDSLFTAELEPASVSEPGFSMSATFGDLDGDAVPDLYVSNMSSTAAGRILHTSSATGQADPLDALRRQLSRGNTVYLAREGGVGAAPSTGAENANWAWGTALVDYDSDGDLDIHCLNGFQSRGRDDGLDL